MICDWDFVHTGSSFAVWACVGGPLWSVSRARTVVGTKRMFPDIE